MVALPHVLWLGGPVGSGKATIATRLTRRYGLRWYSADAHTWEHRDRALAQRHPGALRWEGMTPSERWVTATPAEMMALSIDGERWPMIADDLRRLPSSPLILAEGTTVRPRLVSAGIADPARAVWLLPTPQFRRDRLEERGWSPGVAEFHRLHAVEIEREVAELGMAVLRTGSQTVEETLALVEERFAQPLREGPSAGTRAQRRALIRYANAAVVAQVRAFYARTWADGDADSVERTFACECGDPGCVAEVELPVGSFPAGPLLADGHR